MNLAMLWRLGLNLAEVCHFVVAGLLFSLCSVAGGSVRVLKWAQSTPVGAIQEDGPRAPPGGVAMETLHSEEAKQQGAGVVEERQREAAVGEIGRAHV